MTTSLCRYVAFDLETFPGRWCVGFHGLDQHGELTTHVVETRGKLRALLKRFAAQDRTLVGYNSQRFDVPLVQAILKGLDPYAQAQSIINDNQLPPSLKSLPAFPIDHLDLAGRLRRGGAFPGLKTVAAHMGRPVLRELPFPPGSILTDEQWEEVKSYNVIDLGHTWALLEQLAPELESLAALSRDQKQDLRSVSTPQVVERVFIGAYHKQHGRDPARIDPPHEVSYRPVAGVTRPRTKEASDWFDLVVNEPIPMVPRGEHTVPNVPTAKFSIGHLKVSVGSGGLHSFDLARVYYATKRHLLLSVDVASFYPSLIAAKGISPAGYGDTGRDTYRSLLDRRLAVKKAAKAEADPTRQAELNVQADGLKLVLNSFFGKTGDPFSTLYDPGAFLTVTLSGQLMLIDLVERLTAAKVRVISANTDGLFLSVPREHSGWRAILEQWQVDTGMKLDVEPLRRLAILATNQYATRDIKDKVKRKGGELRGSLDWSHSPNHLVVNDAIVQALLFDVPTDKTIFACRDLVRFCFVTRRSGAAVSMVLVDGDSVTELPRVTRWYRAKDTSRRIETRLAGGRHTTPSGAHAVTICQDLPARGIPADIDWTWYLGQARRKVQNVPGYHHLAKRHLKGNPIATQILEAGLFPVPKRGKAQLAGSDVKHPTLLWDFNSHSTCGVYTGPPVLTLVLDIDQAERWRKFVDKDNDPLFADRWKTIEGALVSVHGEATAEGVRAGRDRGKLIFRFDGGPDHPLCRMSKAKWLKSRGVEVFYGHGLPSVLGQYDDNGDRYRLEGTLTEVPAWVVEELTPKERVSKPKPAAVTAEAKLEALSGVPAMVAELCPELGDPRVGWKRKDLGDKWEIFVGNCCYAAEHASGRGGYGDLSCGFSENGPWIRCLHESCVQIREVNRRLHEKWQREHPPELTPKPSVNGHTNLFRLKKTKLSEIQVQPVEYLVEGYFFEGKLNLIAGPAGRGKSTLVYHALACFANGKPAFGLDYEPPPPMEVLVYSGEENFADTIAPRLRAAGADMTKISRIDGVRGEKGDEHGFHFGYLDTLRTDLKACPETKVVLLDPVTSPITGAGADQNSEGDVRELLERLHRIAEETGVTFLLIKNFNKDESKSASGRVSGTHAYVDVCRANYVIDKDPNVHSRRIMAPFKINGPDEPSAFAFRLEPLAIAEAIEALGPCDHLSPEKKTKLASQLRRVVFEGKTSHVADDLVKKHEPPDTSAVRKRAAADWLKQRLEQGPVGSILAATQGDFFLGLSPPSNDLPQEAKERIIMGRVKWWRAEILKNLLGGASRKYQGRWDSGGVWFFILPGQDWPPSEAAIKAAETASMGNEEACENATNDRQTPF
jgi:AAA domain/DNA polymerase family B